MDDTGPSPQAEQPVQIAHEASKAEDAPGEKTGGPDKSEDKEAETAVPGTNKEAETDAAESQREPGSRASGPKPPQQPKRPQGKGRIKRFTMQTNTPFIQHADPRPSQNRGRQLEQPDSQTTGSIDATVQVPGSITLDPAVLHVEPAPASDTKPQVVPPIVSAAGQTSGEGKAVPKPRPPSLVLASATRDARDAGRATAGVPRYPSPTIRPRPLRLAHGERGTTLYHLLSVVNQTLGAEMKQSLDVHQALSEDAQGPMRVLGPLGRLVQLLFRSMEEHRTASWRRKKAALGRNHPSSNTTVLSPTPFRGALGIFSVSVTRFSRLPRWPANRGAKRTLKSTKATVQTENSGSEADSDFSAMEPGIPRDGRDGAAYAGDDDKPDPVWRAIQRSDRRAVSLKRARRDADADDADASESSWSDCDGEGSDAAFYQRPSPSLPAKTNPFADGLDPRRHKTFVIDEDRKNEAAAERSARREAGAVRPRGRPAAAAAGDGVPSPRKTWQELQAKAQQTAENAVQKRLAALEDERDAALYLAETATCARDEMEAEREALRKESAKLHRLMRALVGEDFAADASDDGGGAQEAAEAALREDEGQEEEEEEPQQAQQEDRAAGDGVPPSPASTTDDGVREQMLDEVRRYLRERAQPPTPPAQQEQHDEAPRPARPAYTITKRRTPLGTSFAASVLDVLYAVALILVRQKDNLQVVAAWAWLAFVVPAHRSLVLAGGLFWDRLRARGKGLQREQPRGGGGSGALDVPAAGQQHATAAPAPGTAVALRSRETQLAAARCRARRRWSLLDFPRDELAQLVLALAFVLLGWFAAAGVAERNLWLDANGEASDWPRNYLHSYVLHYRRDTDTCEAMPRLGPGAYHACLCLPTFVDTRILVLLAKYFLYLAIDGVRDYVWFMSMYMAGSLHRLFMVVRRVYDPRAL